jgi:hypothetical protein
LSNIVLALVKIVLALVFVSSSIHALITHAKKTSFNPIMDPILSFSSLLSYFPRSVAWVILLVSIGIIIVAVNAILKR